MGEQEGRVSTEDEGVLAPASLDVLGLESPELCLDGVLRQDEAFVILGTTMVLTEGGAAPCRARGHLVPYLADDGYRVDLNLSAG